MKRENRTLPVLLSVSCVLIATLGAIFSPSIYHWFSNAAGYEGNMISYRSSASKPEILTPVIKVRLDTNVMPGLGWSFTPEKSVISTRIDTPTLVYFRVQNRSKKAPVARAIFNVTPDPSAYYFMKADSFCLKDVKLKAGESARLAVMFYFDKAILRDQETESTRAMTISYTFFLVKSDAAALQQAVSLRKMFEAQLRDYALPKVMFTADPNH